MPTDADKLAKAYDLGHKRALHDINVKNQKVPVEDVWETKDEQDVFVAVTGDKLDRDTELASLILDNYENGYYDAEEWENN